MLGQLQLHIGRDAMMPDVTHQKEIRNTMIHLKKSLIKNAKGKILFAFSYI